MTRAGGNRPNRIEPAAYAYWATDGKRNVRETAKTFDVPVRTVYYWKDHYRWDARWRELVEPIVAESVDTAKLQVKLALTDAARRLHTIVQTGADRDAVLAARLLFRISDNAWRNHNGKHLTLIDARAIAVGNDAPIDSLDDVRKQVSGYITQNIESANVDTYKRR